MQGAICISIPFTRPDWVALRLLVAFILVVLLVVLVSILVALLYHSSSVHTSTTSSSASIVGATCLKGVANWMQNVADFFSALKYKRAS